MPKTERSSPILLRWSSHVPASEVQDPLGLGLRGSTRLASRLLYGITSITSRARYFSFIPWAIFDHREHEKGNPHAPGLREGIIIREQVLTLACIAHHKGDPCSGGGLVGTRAAKRWFAKGGREANFGRMKPFSKNPALGVYFNSLVNLGLFVTDAEKPDSDEEETDTNSTFDDIELSELGLDLAKRFNQRVARLATTREITSKNRRYSMAELAKFGSYGGLCELSQEAATDRQLLREIFFASVTKKGESHTARRQSLLLTLDLCRQFSEDNWQLTETEFAKAVYYGELANEDSRLAVTISPRLRDIATRWRMFYFHHYMSVALEGLFSWVVSHVATRGLAGETVEAMVAHLKEPSLRKTLSDLLGVKQAVAFGEMTPCGLLEMAGVTTDPFDQAATSSIDATIRINSALAEDNLEELIRSNEYLYSSAGLALPMALLSVTLARYGRWDSTNYGKWLASAANDPFLDLVPPLVSSGLSRRFGSWWKSTFAELTAFVLSRYVIQQHQSLSYEKTWTGERCLLQIDGSQIVSTGGFDKVGMGNPRLGSAIQILVDLGLIEVDEENLSSLTAEGTSFLKRELAKEVPHEVH